ncbi:MAG: hypothetical protein ACJ74H_10495, partial [Thermoanaerobaculia bacterium]
DDRDPKEIEREKYGDRTNNFNLFGADAFNAAVDAIEEEPAVAAAPSTSFAAHAAAFHESPITPELSALEIVPLEGIRDRKVKEIALEVAYPRMSEDTVRKIREIVEEHAGEVPVTVTIVDLPAELAESTGGPRLRLKVNHHFKVQPGPGLKEALAKVHANASYLF